MAHIEIQDGVLTTHRFGDRVQIRVPAGGRVEICTEPTHTDVQVKERGGTISRQFRLPREPA
ncbi:MAG: hypothetical protein Q8Q14_07275 [Gemmatimonadales bacterium]|nr:hypothetical protein [Gemmatimonadales bacterium]